MNGRTFAVTCIVLVLCGLLLRSWTAARNPIPDGDGTAAYVLLGDHLSRGMGFQTTVKWTLYDDSDSPLRPEGNRQPLFPLFLSSIFLVAGTGMAQAQLGTILIGIAAMAICTAWASRLFGRPVALLVLAYMAVDPPFIWYSAQPHSLMLYVTIFYLTLYVADRENVSTGRAGLLGALSGLTWLIRTQGMLLIPAMAVWVLIRGGERRWLKTATCLLAALVVMSPWMVRNIRAFGSQTHSQNYQFLINENHWAASEVRESAPSPMDMLEHRGPAAVASFLAAGTIRVLEPFTVGGQHGEPYSQPTLAVFVVLGILALLHREERRKMLLPLLAVAPVLLALILHQHPGRYMMIAVPATVALGGRGLELLSSEPGRRKLVPLLLALCGLTLLRPTLLVLRTDSRERASEAMETVEWIRDNTPDSSWVCTYPNADLFPWIYENPILIWPNDYEMLLWPYVREQGVEYLVVDQDLPYKRPWLSRCWLRTSDGSDWAIVDPPPFLTEVWRTGSGNTIVYQFSGDVPEGYMAVDSLPRDNMRAQPPAGDR